MTNKHRIFIGLELSGYLTKVISMVRSTIDDKKQLIHWINGRKLHLTLSFLGDINSIDIEKLTIKLKQISKFKSFNITVCGTGSFHYKEAPKILWLDIEEGRDELINIQNSIEKIGLPFKQNQKSEEFIPHVTIGRIKKLNKNFNLSTFSNAVYSDIRIPIKTIYLFKSQLLDKGVEYSIISEYPLK